MSSGRSRMWVFSFQMIEEDADKDVEGLVVATDIRAGVLLKERCPELSLRFA